MSNTRSDLCWMLRLTVYRHYIEAMRLLNEIYLYISRRKTTFFVKFKNGLNNKTDEKRFRN